MIFYLASALVALFCAIALGLGPAVFALAGAGVAVVGFRARRPRWWGFPLAAAGAVEALGALAGLRARSIVEVALVLFAVLVVVRVTGHRAAAPPAGPHPRSRRDRPLPRRE